MRFHIVALLLACAVCATASADEVLLKDGRKVEFVKVLRWSGRVLVVVQGPKIMLIERSRIAGINPENRWSDKQVREAVEKARAATDQKQAIEVLQEALPHVGTGKARRALVHDLATLLTAAGRISEAWEALSEYPGTESSNALLATAEKQVEELQEKLDRTHSANGRQAILSTLMQLGRIPGAGVTMSSINNRARSETNAAMEELAQRRVNPCSDCGGDGAKTCEKCSGSGKVRVKKRRQRGGNTSVLVTCTTCEGSAASRCRSCAQSGIHLKGLHKLTASKLRAIGQLTSRLRKEERASKALGAIAASLLRNKHYIPTPLYAYARNLRRPGAYPGAGSGSEELDYTYKGFAHGLPVSSNDVVESSSWNSKYSPAGVDAYRGRKLLKLARQWSSAWDRLSTFAPIAGRGRVPSSSPESATMRVVSLAEICDRRPVLTGEWITVITSIRSIRSRKAPFPHYRVDLGAPVWAAAYSTKARLQLLRLTPATKKGGGAGSALSSWIKRYPFGQASAQLKRLPRDTLCALVGRFQPPPSNRPDRLPVFEIWRATKVDSALAPNQRETPNPNTNTGGNGTNNSTPTPMPTPIDRSLPPIPAPHGELGDRVTKADALGKKAEKHSAEDDLKMARHYAQGALTWYRSAHHEAKHNVYLENRITDMVELTADLTKRDGAMPRKLTYHSRHRLKLQPLEVGLAGLKHHGKSFHKNFAERIRNIGVTAAPALLNALTRLNLGNDGDIVTGKFINDQLIALLSPSEPPAWNTMDPGSAGRRSRLVAVKWWFEFYRSREWPK